jgi:hypothetical protein
MKLKQNIRGKKAKELLLYDKKIQKMIYHWLNSK